MKVIWNCEIIDQRKIEIIWKNVLGNQNSKRVLQNHNMKVSMKPVSISKNYLMRPKDVIPT